MESKVRLIDILPISYHRNILVNTLGHSYFIKCKNSENHLKELYIKHNMFPELLKELKEKLKGKIGNYSDTYKIGVYDILERYAKSKGLI